MRGTTYTALSEYAKKTGGTRSGLVEKWILEKLPAVEPRFELDDEQPEEPEDGEFASGIKLL